MRNKDREGPLHRPPIIAASQSNLPQRTVSCVPLEGGGRLAHRYALVGVYIEGQTSTVRMTILKF